MQQDVMGEDLLGHVRAPSANQRRGRRTLKQRFLKMNRRDRRGGGGAEGLCRSCRLVPPYTKSGM